MPVWPADFNITTPAEHLHPLVTGGSQSPFLPSVLPLKMSVFCPTDKHPSGTFCIQTKVLGCYNISKSFAKQKDEFNDFCTLQISDHDAFLSIVRPDSDHFKIDYTINLLSVKIHKDPCRIYSSFHYFK